MYHVSAQGVDERIINVHYFYCYAQTWQGNGCTRYRLTQHWVNLLDLYLRNTNKQALTNSYHPPKRSRHSSLIPSKQSSGGVVTWCNWRLTQNGWNINKIANPVNMAWVRKRIND